MKRNNFRHAHMVSNYLVSIYQHSKLVSDYVVSASDGVVIEQEHRKIYKPENGFFIKTERMN